jgi:hypothetical protein
MDVEHLLHPPQVCGRTVLVASLVFVAARTD